MTAPPPSNTYPYNENYFLSVERQITASTLVSASYVGSQAHHLLVVYSANPGNPALCLALSKPSAVAPGSPTCGPFGEDTAYITAAGKRFRERASGSGRTSRMTITTRAWEFEFQFVPVERAAFGQRADDFAGLHVQ